MPVPSDNLTNITDRPNYYAGQYLLEDDFQLEQQYHLDRLRRHHRLLHVAGIVQGLVVEPVDNPLTKVKITAGTAIDAEGRQIVLAQDKADFALPTTIPGNGSILSIQYESVESSTQGTPTPTTESATPDNSPETTTAALTAIMDGKSRIKEEPFLSWGDTAPPGAIALARVSPKKELDFSDRVYSGIRLPSPHNKPGKGLTFRYKGNGTPAAGEIELAEFTGNLSISGTLAVKGTSTLSGSLSVKNQVFLSAGKQSASAITASGNIAIVDASPQIDFVDTEDGHNDWAIHVNSSKMYFIREPWNCTDLVLDGKGNVGIGTDSPNAKLEVKGNIKATDATLGTLAVTGISTLTGNTTLSGQVTVQPTITTTTADTTLTAVHIKPTFTLTPTTLAGVKQNGLIVESGNVGIGTTTPAAKLAIDGALHVGGDSDPGGKNLWVEGDGKFKGTLEVNGNLTVDRKIWIGDGKSTIHEDRVNTFITSQTGDAGIAIAQKNTDSNKTNVNVLIQASGDGGYIGTTSAHPLVLRTDDEDRLTIDEEGLIGLNGPIREQMYLIKCEGRDDWGKKNHPIKQYFLKKLSQKPPGTLIRAVANHPTWDNTFWIAWVSRNNEVRLNSSRNPNDVKIASLDD
jgi:hypothetical protein